MSMNRTCPISNFTSEADSGDSIGVDVYPKSRDLRVELIDYVRDGDFVSIASLQLGEKVAHLRGSVYLRFAGRNFTFGRPRKSESWVQTTAL